LLDLHGREPIEIILGRGQCAAENADTASFAATLAAAWKLHAMGEQEILKRLARFGVESLGQGEQLDLNGTPCLHGAC
jgi:hypothetical protein